MAGMEPTPGMLQQVKDQGRPPVHHPHAPDNGQAVYAAPATAVEIKGDGHDITMLNTPGHVTKPPVGPPAGKPPRMMLDDDTRRGGRLSDDLDRGF